MTNYNKLVWELIEGSENQYSIYENILAEFKEVENKLLEELRSGNPINQDLLQYRNKLNKLLARSAPYAIEEYNFLKQYHRQERATQ